MNKENQEKLFSILIPVGTIFLGIIAKSPFLIIVGLFFLYLNVKKLNLQNMNLEDFLKKQFKNKQNPFSNLNINEKPMETVNPKKAKGLAGLIVGAVIALIVLANSIVIIPAGYTGVYHLFGKVKDKAYPSGLHIINPLAKIEKMNVRTQDYTMSIAATEGQRIGDDSIAALTKEGLNVALDITVLYHLEEQKAPEVYRTIGLNYPEVIIRPEIRTSIREVVAQYSAKDIYSEKRTEAGIKILEQLKQKIEPRGVVIEDVLLRHVELPKKLAESIEAKLQAEQEAQRYEFVLQKEEKEAERKRVEAAGQRDAQQIIAQGLTQNYLNYLYIQTLKDREGTIYVPTNPSNGTPLFRGI